MYGICLLSVIPMRKLTSHKSEMINQVLFGESFQILEKEKGWAFIKLFHDNYKGWIRSSQYVSISKKISKIYFSNKKNSTIKINKIKQPLILGSMIPKEKSINKKLKIDCHLNFCDINNFENFFLSLSKKYLNTPYLWGGRSTVGIDCSGLTQMIYRFFNINLPRDSHNQSKKGKEINFATSNLGDLAFFEEKNKITHVGIILNKKKIMHASEKVRIDQIDKKGIYNSELKKYTHKLKIIKRVF